MKRYRKIVIWLAFILIIVGVTTCITVYKADNGSTIDNDSGIKPTTEVGLEINKKDTVKNNRYEY